MPDILFNTDSIKSHPQSGGKLLGEGADGCIFEAPNWPCETPLNGYDPKDKSLVTKIVNKTDNEDGVLGAIKQIQKSSLHHNLIHYVGKCTPRTKDFNKTQKRIYTTHCKQMKGTKKACKDFLRLLQHPSKSPTKYKMYVLGKYKATYKGLCEEIAKSNITREEKAEIFYQAFGPFITTLRKLIEGSKYRVINYDLHSANIVVFQKSPSMLYNPLHPQTYEIGFADFGRAIWEKTGRGYRTYKEFVQWNKSYLDMFLKEDSHDKIGKTYYAFNQFSLESRLMNYILVNPNKQSSLYIEDFAKDKDVKQKIKEANFYDMTLMILPEFIKVIKSSTKYRTFEKELKDLVLELKNKSLKQQYDILKTSRKKQEFLDSMKTRSHLPTAVGVYILRALRACGYSKSEIEDIVTGRKPTVSVLETLLHTYKDMLYAPYL